jgi:alkylation response protein AidB-like acyl-CoA dehydrogenase
MTMHTQPIGAGHQDQTGASDLGLLRSVLREFCDEQMPSPHPRPPSDGLDHTLWRRIAQELELTGFSVPTEYGGAGFSWGDQAVVFEELGRSLTSLPYFASVALATTALLATADDNAKARYLPGLADGSRVGALATTDDSQDRGARAWSVEQHFRLGGRKLFVLDAQYADLLLVSATVSGAGALFAVEASAPGVFVEPMNSLDLTRGVAQVTMTNVAAELIGEVGGAPDYLRRARDLANGALAAEQVGGIERCLEMSVAYAADRHQFGRAIGSFQAIKHKCVDMLVQLELARSLALDACSSAAAGSETLSLAASSACAFATTAYRAAAAETIQIHGGIGFTWEHEAHLHYRRAATNASLHTSARQLRETIADLCCTNPALRPNSAPVRADDPDMSKETPCQSSVTA